MVDVAAANDDEVAFTPAPETETEPGALVGEERVAAAADVSDVKPEGEGDEEYEEMCAAEWAVAGPAAGRFALVLLLLHLPAWPAVFVFTWFVWFAEADAEVEKALEG